MSNVALSFSIFSMCFAQRLLLQSHVSVAFFCSKQCHSETYGLEMPGMFAVPRLSIRQPSRCYGPRHLCWTILAQYGHDLTFIHFLWKQLCSAWLPRVCLSDSAKVDYSRQGKLKLCFPLYETTFMALGSSQQLKSWSHNVCIFIHNNQPIIRHCMVLSAEMRYQSWTQRQVSSNCTQCSSDIVSINPGCIVVLDFSHVMQWPTKWFKDFSLSKCFHFSVYCMCFQLDTLRSFG